MEQSWKTKAGGGVASSCMELSVEMSSHAWPIGAVGRHGSIDGWTTGKDDADLYPEDGSAVRG